MNIKVSLLRRRGFIFLKETYVMFVLESAEKSTVIIHLLRGNMLKKQSKCANIKSGKGCPISLLVVFLYIFFLLEFLGVMYL